MISEPCLFTDQLSLFIISRLDFPQNRATLAAHENPYRHRSPATWTWLRRLRLKRLFAFHPHAANPADSRRRLHASVPCQRLCLCHWRASGDWRLTSPAWTLRPAGSYDSRRNYRQHFDLSHPHGAGRFSTCTPVYRPRAVPGVAVSRSFYSVAQAVRPWLIEEPRPATSATATILRNCGDRTCGHSPFVARSRFASRARITRADFQRRAKQI